MVVIEMNPRVSRSSALASKATGFPIAKVAAKLAVGYTLDELATTSPAEPRRLPSSRRSTTWSPRCRALPSRSSTADARLTTQMKSVGEVMAIGRNFQESLQKALRGLEVGLHGTRSHLAEGVTEPTDELIAELINPGAERIWHVATPSVSA
jgi:carbamoyl-phosphate synthase large subunit